MNTLHIHIYKASYKFNSFYIEYQTLYPAADITRLGQIDFKYSIYLPFQSLSLDWRVSIRVYKSGTPITPELQIFTSSV